MCIKYFVYMRIFFVFTQFRPTNELTSVNSYMNISYSTGHERMSSHFFSTSCLSIEYGKRFDVDKYSIAYYIKETVYG
jgi:hypothetical protein